MRLFAAPAITKHPTMPFVLPAIVMVVTILSVSTPNLAYAQSATNTKDTSNTQSATQPSQTQAVKIQGVSYATGVKLGMPVPVLIRAKARSQKLNNKKPDKQ